MTNKITIEVTNPPRLRYINAMAKAMHEGAIGKGKPWEDLPDTSRRTYRRWAMNAFRGLTSVPSPMKAKDG